MENKSQVPVTTTVAPATVAQKSENPNVRIVATAYYEAEQLLLPFASDLEISLADMHLSRAELLMLAMDAPGALTAIRKISSVSVEFKTLTKSDLNAMWLDLAAMQGGSIEGAKTTFEAIGAFAAQTFRNADSQVKATRTLITRFRKARKA